MCEHVGKNKITFFEFLKLKRQGKTICFYCKECNKLFIARRQGRMNWLITIIYYVAYAVLVMAVNLNAPVYIDVLMVVLCAAVSMLLQLYLEWKSLLYKEISVSALKAGGEYKL